MSVQLFTTLTKGSQKKGLHVCRQFIAEPPKDFSFSLFTSETKSLASATHWYQNFLSSAYTFQTRLDLKSSNKVIL